MSEQQEPKAINPDEGQSASTGGLEQVTKFDHPDLVGGIVWAGCELSWINNRITLAIHAERERICAAIKSENSYCYDMGDYMMDSDDCIAVVRGEWERPDFCGSNEQN